MAATMTISLRVTPELREQLERAAADNRMSMSAVAVAFIRDGLNGTALEVDGPLVKAVAGLFEDLAGHGEPVEREMALQLGRTAQAGGTAGVSAIRELRALVASLVDDEPDEWAADLAVPD